MGCVMTSYRPVSSDAITHVKDFESLRLQTYDDLTGIDLFPGEPYVGTPTVGYGNISNALPPREITAHEAEYLLAQDAQDTFRTIYSYVPNDVIDSLPQKAYDALFGFVFNVGAQAFRRPGDGATDFMRALLSKRRDIEVPAQMLRWVYSKGRRLGGLIRRRAVEAQMWAEGYASTITPHAGVVPEVEPPARRAAVTSTALAAAGGFGAVAAAAAGAPIVAAAVAAGAIASAAFASFKLHTEGS